MKSGNRAFSLTELLIVMVVIALLFCALAPIITKRHVSETHASDSIWNFVPGDSEKNFYFDPGYEQWTSSIYMGMVPPSTNDSSAGKLVLNSGDITYDSNTYKQPQLQFRFSADTTQQGRGVNAANLFVNDTNLIFGSSPVSDELSKTTVYGLSNLKNVTKAKTLTILGNDAMGNARISEYGSENYIVAIGNRAANKIGWTDSSTPVSGIYIGANSGSGLAEETSAPTDNVAIGYNTMSKNGALGSYNVFLGAYTGNGFDNANASYNTIVGSVFSGQNASYNTIIGYGVYADGDPNITQMTAIGYGACNSINSVENGPRICIGYNSAYSTNNTPTVFNTDFGEHIFIGGKPQIPSTYSRGFPGRSVLEVHNIQTSDGTEANVVLNSNLVVRGNYYTSGGSSDGRIGYNVFSDTKSIAGEGTYYRCNNDVLNDSFILNKYFCNNLVEANPKSINVLVKSGNCSTSDGYTNGSGCPKITTSDARLKENITPNNDGLEKILKLKAYSYTYKNDANTPQVGVIAQDLIKIFPNSVTKDEKGYYKIRWDEMFYALLNSIKSLAAKVESLFAQVTNFDNDLNLIKADQSSIKNQISALNKRIKKLEKE